jgi:hypothetical protein
MSTQTKPIERKGWFSTSVTEQEADGRRTERIPQVPTKLKVPNYFLRSGPGRFSRLISQLQSSQIAGAPRLAHM